MNQILTVDNTKKSKSKGGPLEIQKVLRIFSIIILIFGILLISTGVFALTSNTSENTQNSVPVVTLSQNGNKITISIKHDKAIDKAYYSWNNDTEQTLQGRGSNMLTQEIDVIAGTNTLHVRVVDVFGVETTYEKIYELENADITSPTIELISESSKIKITVKDETKLAYMEYYWNDEEATRVEVNENTPKIIEERIEVLKGENTLTVYAVDEAGNEETKSQDFKTSTKPTIAMSRDGQNIIITVNDEENIQKVDIELNGQTYSTDAANTGEALNRKELSLTLPLVSGSNTIKVHAYNVNGLEREESTQISVE